MAGTAGWGLGLALLSAFTSAFAHVMLKSGANKLAALAWVRICEFVVALPFVLWIGLPPADLWVWLIAAALAHGLVAAHNVCLDLKNPDVVRGDATRARMEYGFQRMWSIYPAQIQPIVEAMRPDYSEAEDAAAVLLAAQAASWGPIQYKGELYDRASYRYYWKTLQRARLSGLAIGAEAEQAFFA